MSILTQVYEQLKARREALLRLYGPKSGLKESNPSAYLMYRQEIRDINRRLRELRIRIDTLKKENL